MREKLNTEARRAGREVLKMWTKAKAKKLTVKDWGKVPLIKHHLEGFLKALRWISVEFQGLSLCVECIWLSRSLECSNATATATTTVTHSCLLRIWNYCADDQTFVFSQLTATFHRCFYYLLYSVLKGEKGWSSKSFKNSRIVQITTFLRFHNFQWVSIYFNALHQTVSWKEKSMVIYKVFKDFKFSSE